MRRDTRLLQDSIHPNPNTMKRLLSPSETRSELQRKIRLGLRPGEVEPGREPMQQAVRQMLIREAKKNMDR